MIMQFIIQALEKLHRFVEVSFLESLCGTHLISLCNSQFSVNGQNMVLCLATSPSVDEQGLEQLTKCQIALYTSKMSRIS